MSELLQTINIRTTFEMKKRILANAEKQGMNQSEYILFAVESYLKGISNNNTDSVLEIDNLQLKQLQEQLAATNNQLGRKSLIGPKFLYYWTYRTKNG